jgi:hypothetical protein
MRKLIVLFMFLLMACGGVVSQQEVLLQDEIAGLGDGVDIPLTNMPGHELPECPLECICPQKFGLKDNPCFPSKKCEIPKIVWNRFDDDLLDRATKNNKLVMLFYVDYNDDEGYNIIDNLNKDLCFVVESWENYYLARTDDLDLYYHALNDHSKDIKWRKGNYVTSPAIAVFYNGYALPITFESKSWFSDGKLPYHPTNPSHLCVVAKSLRMSVRVRWLQ